MRTRRLMWPGLVLVAAVALLALLAFGVAAQGTHSSIDAQVAQGKRPVAPNATMALPVLGASGARSLASLRGQIVVVNVFASWCQPCQAEAPVLENEQRILLGHRGTVLGVTYLDNSSDSARFVRQWHITYPVVRDVSGDFVRSFGTTGVPETFVVDRRGRVAAIRRFQLTASWLNQTLPPLLAQSS